MSVATLLLIVIAIGLMVVMHTIGQSGRLRRSPDPHEEQNEEQKGVVGGIDQADPQKGAGQRHAHQHGRGGCC